MDSSAVARAETAGAPAGWRALLSRQGEEPVGGMTAVRMGAGFCVVSAAVSLSTMWFLPHTASLLPVAVAEATVAVVAVGFAAARSDVVLPSRLLLVYPGLIFVALFVAGTTERDVGGAYLGLVTLCFVYVGLTQARGTAVWLVPVAMPLWWYCQTTPPAETAVRLSIVVAVWLVVSEVLAFRTHSIRTQLGRLTDDASTDALTGLGNRRSLDAALASLAEGDSVVVIDLDNFKAINDEFGHAAGDRVLADFAGTVRSVLRSGDTAFRLGGEEVVIILRRGPGAPGGAEALLARLRNRWASDSRPTFSAGACVHDGSHPSQTVQRADGALYRAKKAGRNCWRLAAPSA